MDGIINKVLLEMHARGALSFKSIVLELETKGFIVEHYHKHIFPVMPSLFKAMQRDFQDFHLLVYGKVNKNINIIGLNTDAGHKGNFLFALYNSRLRSLTEMEEIIGLYNLKSFKEFEAKARHLDEPDDEEQD